MKAIILAAGRGSRMGELTDDLPKCRTKLQGKELIAWQMDALQDAGIKDIGIVRGYLAETFDFDVTYFENERWAETNMVMSLATASAWLTQEPCIISYSDIVYSSDAVHRLINRTEDLAITYDPNWRALWELRFEDPLSDAETFKIDGNRLIEIGNRASTLDEIEGQYMGLIGLTPEGWGHIEELLVGQSQEEKDRMDCTTLLQALISRNSVIEGVPIGDRWYEVDSERDLLKYESMESLL